MPATGSLRRNGLEAACAAFVLANLAVMLEWPSLIRVPYFLTWITLTVVYGFRPWSAGTTVAAALSLSLATVAVVAAGGFEGDELWAKIVPLPLLAGMFAATAWHARRRVTAQRRAEALAAARASLLERQRQFVDDASHELRTPVTIARGHLELLQRETPDAPELDVALDELARMERIVDRLLLLAKADQPDFVAYLDVQIDRFLEDVFLRWSEVAERTWRLELDVVGVVRIDPEAVRSALDALLENAVKYTEPLAPITLRAYADAGQVVIEVEDEGAGIPVTSLSTIFDRFARADDARAREHGGAGLGLAIVAAIAKAHGGSCAVEPRESGTVFVLRLPVGTTVAVEPAAERLEELRTAAGLTRS